MTRPGGVQEVGGRLKLVEEHGFATWMVGQRLLVFLKWFDEGQSYTLPFGSDSAFKLDATTNTWRAFSRSRFGRSHDGKSVAALLAEVKAAR